MVIHPTLVGVRTDECYSSVIHPTLVGVRTDECCL
jgi:hypothetical protein